MASVLDGDVIIYNSDENKEKILADVEERILRRLGSPTVEVYTHTESIRSFIEEAVEKFRPYCADGNRKSGLFEVKDNVCNLPFNVRDIIDVYPRTPHGVSEINNLFNNNDLFGDNSFTWTYRDRNSISCNSFTGSVYVIYTDYGKYSYEDLSEFYKSLAFRWALALTKESEANIRGKFDFGNSPFTTNAADLKSEANDEFSAIEEILENQPLLKSATIRTF